MDDFDYLKPGEVYLDSACQTLRPRPVIDSLKTYYETHNSCGERVKYNWGKITDQKVAATRAKVLKLLHLRPKDYTVSFTLNTTYSINLLLNQFGPNTFKKIITSDIEHNSPFLVSMAFAKKNQVERIVLSRNPDGSIPLNNDFKDALVIVNCASNFDGRRPANLKALIQKVHQSGGRIIIDAAQAMAHSADILNKTDADAICFSAHKLYAPSLGVIVWKNQLLPLFEPYFLGGGMVNDVTKDSYELSTTNPEHLHTRFEPGLQAWGEIIGLGVALDWLSRLPKSTFKNLENNAKNLFNFLNSYNKVHLVNQGPNPTISCYIENLDSHLLSSALARDNIMTRSGYFCAHYYLDHVCHYPPLIRFSLGLHNRPEDIEKVKTILSKILN